MLLQSIFLQFDKQNCNYSVEDTFNKYLNRHHIPNNAFSLLHLNIRSVPTNFTSFLSYISKLNHNFSIIGLSETWLKQSNISAYVIDGYSHIGLTRSNAMGGGLSLLISDEFVFCELAEYSEPSEHWTYWVFVCKYIKQWFYLYNRYSIPTNQL